MSNNYAYFPYVDEFHIDSDYDDPDRVTVSLIARDEVGARGVIKFVLDGDITYLPENVPFAEDFLQQFAAIMGYSVVKD